MFDLMVFCLRGIREAPAVEKICFVRCRTLSCDLAPVRRSSTARLEFRPGSQSFIGTRSQMKVSIWQD